MTGVQTCALPIYAFTNVIDVYIKRLRAKLDAGGAPRLIHTRRGEGYILSAKAEVGDE